MSIADNIKLLEGAIGRMTARFAPVEQVIDQRRIIATRVSMKMEPIVRQCFVDNYHASGLKVKSGKLLDAVKNCDVKIINGYVTAGLRAGYDKKVYVRAALHQHGGVRGPAGQKTKKKLKQAFRVSQVKSQGGFTYIEPHPYFYLSESQLNMLRAKYTEILNETVAKYSK